MVSYILLEYGYYARPETSTLYYNKTIKILLTVSFIIQSRCNTTKDMMMDETQTTSRESNTPFYLSLKTIYFPSLATNPEVYSYRLSIASAY